MDSIRNISWFIQGAYSIYSRRAVGLDPSPPKDLLVRILEPLRAPEGGALFRYLAVFGLQQRPESWNMIVLWPKSLDNTPDYTILYHILILYTILYHIMSHHLLGLMEFWELRRSR